MGRHQPIGQLISGVRAPDASIDWAPLLAAVGVERARSYVWLGAVRLEDGVLLHVYKDAVARVWLHLDHLGVEFTYETSPSPSGAGAYRRAA